MLLSKMPVGVMDRSDRIQRNLLWEENSRSRKLHLMKWSEVIKVKARGGLGLGSSTLKNRALLAKWSWRWGRRAVLVEEHCFKVW